MGHSIIKLTEGDQSWYLEWSTVCDAPLTYGMSLEEFTEYYRDEYGRSCMDEFAKRMERVERCGTSSRMDKTGDDVISFNRAGKNGTILNKEQIIAHFCKTPDEFDDAEYSKLVPVGEIWEVEE